MQCEGKHPKLKKKRKIKSKPGCSLQGTGPELADGPTGMAEEEAGWPGRSTGEVGATRRSGRWLAATRGGTGWRWTAAVGVPGAGEDDRSGDVVRAAWSTKCLGERPRS